MPYNKLHPEPQANYDEQPDWNVPPSAPPTEVIQAPPPYDLPRPPTDVIHMVHHNNIVIDNATQGMICPHCNARVRMTVERKATCSTYVYAVLLCLCLFWPCVCLPCCCECGYKTRQYCPNCKACLSEF